MPEAAHPDELDAVVAFIAEQQAHLDRRISYVGTDAEGIRAELDVLRPPWATTVLVERAGGTITGVVITEHDVELGRAWVLGPWVAGPWAGPADALLDAALAALPPGIHQHELSGELAHRGLAELAEVRGWVATEPNHVLVVGAETVAGWPDPTIELRAAGPDDVGWIAPLHDAEFPGTFATAHQLVTGSRTVLVADGGYIAGEVHEDGEGFIDFLVVEPGARRAGLGRQLVVALARVLVARSPKGQVGLTVQDHRAPARALYEQLGFRPDGSLVAYRSWT